MKPWFLLVLATSMLTAGDNPSAIAAESRPSIEALSAQAERGDPRAQLALGMRYRDGEGVTKDYEAALHWYRRCADQGDAAGQDNVGWMYLKGHGVPVSFPIAFGYFQAAAAEGHAQGQFNLGNSYFSGQGVEQDYGQAIAAWESAADQGHPNALWRLATLYASGEGVPHDPEKAAALCQSIAEDGHANGALLLGELLAQRGKSDEARRWWAVAAEHGSAQAETLLELEAWRRKPPVPGKSAFLEVTHLYQGWNNCGATSLSMFSRHLGATKTPYDIKRLCPGNPIGTGTDWADLLAVSEVLGQTWHMPTFAHDASGFEEGTALIRQHLDAGQPVVIDFTVVRTRDGKEERFGHTLLVVGYHAERDLYVLKNPNQPPPGIELMSAEALEQNWYSSGYSRLAKGRAARPLIVTAPEGSE